MVAIGLQGVSEGSSLRGNVSVCRRVGVSAFAKHHQIRRDLLVIIAVQKSSLTFPDADAPIRRPADTLPQRCTSPIVLRLGAGLARICLQCLEGSLKAGLREAVQPRQRPGHRRALAG